MTPHWSAIKAWALGLVLIIALPITDMFEVPHFRAISLSFFVAIFLIEIVSRRATVREPRYLMLGCLLVLHLCIGLGITRAPSYGAMKTGLFFCYFIVLGFLVGNWAKNIESQRAFINGALVGGLAIVGLFLLKFGSPLEMMEAIGQYYRFSLGERGNPIHLARYLGIFALLLIVTRFRRSLSVMKIVSFAIAIVAIMYMGLTGSKGPVVALFLGFMVAGFCLAERRLHSVLLVLVGATAFVGGISALIMVMPEEFVNQRVFEKLNTLSNRLPVYQETIAWIAAASPFELVVGHGTGDFGFRALQADARLYPHNIFLELAYENGLVGLALGIACFTWPLFAGWNARAVHMGRDERTILSASMGGYIYWLANAQFSGDLGSNSFLGCFAGLLLAVVSTVKADSRTSVKGESRALPRAHKNSRPYYPNMLR